MSFENNIILGALGLLMFFTLRKHRDIIENFIDVPLRSRKVQVQVDPVTEKVYSIPPITTKTIPDSQKMYMIPSSLQMSIPPRSASADYGVRIRYDKPDEAVRGDSMGSLQYGKTKVYEGYDTPEPKNAIPSSQTTSTPVQTTSTSSVQPSVEPSKPNEIGILEQTAIPIDLYVYAPQKSFQAGQGCPIRGDPAIPVEKKGWFDVPGNADRDLRLGAMSVMGGLNNETTKELMALKAASLGVSNTVGSGVKYTVERSSFVSANAGDLSVKTTAFP